MRAKIIIFCLLICLEFLGYSSLQAQDMITVIPQEYSDALSNPLKGFRPGLNDWDDYNYPRVVRDYIRWNQIENIEDDGVDKIIDFCNTRWAGLEDANIKVIPRVYIDWDDKPGNEYWPADLQTGDWYSDEFKERVVKLIYKLGKAWDNDPRVAWIQTGIIGYWGEQENPVGVDEDGWVKRMGEAFENAFPNKLLLARNQNYWQQEGYKFGVYWDSFAHPGQESGSWTRIRNANNDGRYLTHPVEGEVAYNWGEDVMDPYIGGEPDITLSNTQYTNNIIDVVRELHCSALGWIASYDPNDSNIAANAALLQKEFGYRFVIKEFSITKRAEPGGDINLSFKVKNVGSAPFYEKWPLAFVLVDDSTHDIVFSEILQEYDITTWHPGSNYNYSTREYSNPASENIINTTISIPANIDPDRYMAGVSILEPYSRTPGVFFAVENFLEKSQTQPLSYIGIGMDVAGSLNLDSTIFNDPVIDDNRFYTLEWNGTTYSLTTTSGTGGSVTSGFNSYRENQKVRLEAVAELGYVFSGWSGDLTGTTNPVTISMDKNKNIIANFISVPTYSLTVNAENGDVTLDPSGGIYNTGTVVEIEISPDLGYLFTNWSGDLSGSENPITITLDGDKSITANFISAPIYTLMTNVIGGTITLDPPGPQYTEGTVVQLKATANPNYNFTGWSGDPLKYDFYVNPNYITMDSDKSITATFVGPPEETGLWVETFDMPDGTKIDTGSTAWTAIRSSGIFEVINNRFAISDAGTEGVFTTSEIDISGLSVSVSVDVEGVGGLDPEESANKDYFGLFLIVDGGTEQLIYENYGAQSARTISKSDITGSKLVLIIRGYATAGDEFYFFNNLKVTDTSAPNMLENGDFSQRDAHWSSQVISPAAATFSYDNGECKVDIQAVTNEEWHVNILQQGVSLENGMSYTLAFDARATTDKQVSAKAQFDHDPWTSSLEEPVMITSSMQTYSISWDHTDASDTYKVGLFFGSDTTNVWIDNVKLTLANATGINESEIILPKNVQLMQNYPNPFNPQTTIKYKLLKDTHLSLKVYNIMGELVNTLIEGVQRAGYHQILWDGKDNNRNSVAAGVYIYTLNTNDFHESHKMILLK